MARMTAGWVPEWLSLPKLFRVVTAIIRRSAQIPNGQLPLCSCLLLLCSCLRAYFSDREPMVSAWGASLWLGRSEVTAFPPTGGIPCQNGGPHRGHAELIGERNGCHAALSTLRSIISAIFRRVAVPVS